MQMLFRGSLQSVQERTGKKGAAYTVFEFSPVGGQTFTISGTGHVRVDEKSMRKDIDWTLEVEPSVYGFQTTFRVKNLTGSAK